MASWLLVVAVVGQLSAPAVEVVTLSNGMRWVLLPRPDEGQVSGVVTIRAGSVHEGEGYTGAAHLLEHLAFAGTPVVGSLHGWRVEEPLQQRVFELIDAHTRLDRLGQGNSQAAMQLSTELVAAERDWRLTGDKRAYRRLMAGHDVRINAWTDKDRTTYWGDFPREQLHFWLAAEAQRFAAPVFREFRTERDVVLQELVDRRHPLTFGTDALFGLAFKGTGYAWQTTGREVDLRTISPRDVERFYDEHYAPSAAVGCLVGEFDAAEAKAWLEQTFARVGDRPTVTPPKVTLTRPQTLTRKADEPAVLLGFEAPPEFSQDAAAFALAQEVLGMAEGPLHGLCEAAGPCRSFSISAGPGFAERHLLFVSLRLRKGRTAAEARAGFFRALRAWSPDEEVLAQARATLELERLQDLSNRKQLAETLSIRELFTGDWRSVFEAPHLSTSTQAVIAVLEGFTEEKAWVVELEVP